MFTRSPGFLLVRLVLFQTLGVFHEPCLHFPGGFRRKRIAGLFVGLRIEHDDDRRGGPASISNIRLSSRQVFYRTRAKYREMNDFPPTGPKSSRGAFPNSLEILDYWFHQSHDNYLRTQLRGRHEPAE